MKIAFIGIGHMGRPMALNLVEAGHDVSVYDLSAQALGTLADSAAVVCESLGKAVSGAEMVITMLPEGRHVRAAHLGADGVIANASAGAQIIDCSTIDVSTAREVAAHAAEKGFDMIDAPVSGGVSGAEQATLTFMVGGSTNGFERARPILAAMGRNLVHVGGAGQGQAAKICNNMMAGIHMIAASEALSLGQSLGVDPAILYEIISTSSGRSFMLEKSFPSPGVTETASVNRGFAPGFKAKLMAKDLGLAESAARDVGASTPCGSLAASLYRMLCQRGYGDLDCSAVVKLLDRES